MLTEVCKLVKVLTPPSPPSSSIPAWGSFKVQTDGDSEPAEPCSLCWLTARQTLSLMVHNFMLSLCGLPLFIPISYSALFLFDAAWSSDLVCRVCVFFVSFSNTILISQIVDPVCVSEWAYETDWWSTGWWRERELLLVRVSTSQESCEGL